MDKGVAAVGMRFPGKAKAIDALASRNEVFREICRDFSEAQTELARWEASTDPKRGERCREYGELVADLGSEIEDALEHSAVPALHRPQV